MELKENILEGRVLLPTIELIDLNDRGFAIIDIEDSEKVNQYKWYLRIDKRNKYAVSRKKIDGKAKCIMMHRIVMDAIDPLVLIDHKDHDGLDNRKSNLRPSSNSQNVKHTRKRLKGKCKYLGVSFKKGRNKIKILAQIQCNKKKYHIGYFLTQELAAEAYNKKALELFGEFATLNVID